MKIKYLIPYIAVLAVVLSGCSVPATPYINLEDKQQADTQLENVRNVESTEDNLSDVNTSGVDEINVNDNSLVAYKNNIYGFSFDHHKDCILGAEGMELAIPESDYKYGITASCGDPQLSLFEIEIIQSASMSTLGVDEKLVRDALSSGGVKQVANLSYESNNAMGYTKSEVYKVTIGGYEAYTFTIGNCLSFNVGLNSNIGGKLLGRSVNTSCDNGSINNITYVAKGQNIFRIIYNPKNDDHLAMLNSFRFL